jgi:hypothetical protein
MIYPDIARKLGMSWCGNCPIGNHTHGWADISNGVIHWADRRVERRGLRLFLKLGASIVYSHNRGQPEWRMLYEQNAWAFQIALAAFRVRLNRSYADNDRARARYLARNEHLSVTDPAIYRWLYQKETP